MKNFDAQTKKLSFADLIDPDEVERRLFEKKLTNADSISKIFFNQDLANFQLTQISDEKSQLASRLKVVNQTHDPLQISASPLPNFVAIQSTVNLKSSHDMLSLKIENILKKIESVKQKLIKDDKSYDPIDFKIIIDNNQRLLFLVDLSGIKNKKHSEIKDQIEVIKVHEEFDAKEKSGNFSFYQSPEELKQINLIQSEFDSKVVKHINDSVLSNQKHYDQDSLNQSRIISLNSLTRSLKVLNKRYKSLAKQSVNLL